MLAIKNHRLDGIAFAPARWSGGAITPTIAIVHDTASRLTPGNSAAYLRDNPAKVSVHIVVERDGAIEQQVAFNRRANHAGRSHYHGRRGCNAFSLGIEIVNPGRMRRSGDDCVAWYGQRFNIEEFGCEHVVTAEHGDAWWMPYPEEQIASVEDVLHAMVGKYDTLQDVVGHWYVSPGRKADTNPLFPLEAIKARVLGREEPAEELLDLDTVDGEPDAMVTIDVPGDALNMRRWPSFNPNILVAIPDGTRVPVERSGTFDGRLWQRVIYGGQSGWVVAAYTD